MFELFSGPNRAAYHKPNRLLNETKFSAIMKTKTLPLLTIIFLLVTGMVSVHAQELVKETRQVDEFDRLSLSLAGDVYLKQGPASLVIEADKNILALIDTEVKDGHLTIKFNKCTVPRYEKIKIYVSMPEIRGLSVAGSGDILAEGTIKSNELKLSIAGSGDISLNDLRVADLKASIAGSGDIFLAGTGRQGKLKASISGSGDMEIPLEFENAAIAISGSGDCSVNVTGSLEATIAGSGSVTYEGNPVVNARVAGSGSVKQK